MKIFCIIALLLAIYIFIASGKFFKSMFFTVFIGSVSLILLALLIPKELPIFIATPFFIGGGLLFGIPGIIGMLLLCLAGIF